MEREEGRKGGREEKRGKELEEISISETHTHTCRIQQLHFEIAETLSELKELHLKKENS